MEEVLPVPEVDPMPPLLVVPDQSLVSEFRNMANVMSSIVTRLDRQQTQLNTLQERMLTADLSGANRFSSAAVGVEAIAPPSAHPSQHDVFRGAEAIAPLLHPDVSGAIPQAGLQLRGAEAIAPLSPPGVSDTLPWQARSHRGGGGYSAASPADTKQWNDSTRNSV
jgi:hypothetical protein